MNKPNEATYLMRESIRETRRELGSWQGKARIFASLCRQYRAQKSDLVEPFRIMNEHAFAQVRRLKVHINKLLAIQERLNDLALQIAEIESRMKLLPE